MIILSLLLITFLIIASPYQLGVVSKKLVYTNFDDSERYFFVVKINNELCDFEVSESMVKKYKKDQWILMNTVTYSNARYVKNIIF